MSGGPALHLDFETYAEVDLSEVGLDAYVNHPSFAVTVTAWAFGDGPVQSDIWPATCSVPDAIIAHVFAGGVIHAWNAAFEQAVLRVRGVEVPWEQFDCTMQRSAGAGYPAKLEDAGPAMGVSASMFKDKTARGLMQQMGRPRKGNRPWHETDPAKLEALRQYCVQDVKAEWACDKVLPPLSPFEWRVSRVDAMVNAQGVIVDRNAVSDLVVAATAEAHRLDEECMRLTNGLRSTQRDKLLCWLFSEGVPIASLDKEAVDEALAAGVGSAKAMRVLEIRSLSAKASVAKLERMMVWASVDGRARGLFSYCGASRTKRWAGRGPQVHNLPRAKTDVETLLSALNLDVTALHLLWERPMDAISACIRGCFVAEQGGMLAMIDFAQIEARVLAWLAGQQDVLDIFRRGLDVYTAAAAKVGSYNRQLGKVLTLACGYGMGAGKFQETALTYGVVLDARASQLAVMRWRGGNPAIVRFWYALGNAVVGAISTPGMKFKAHATEVRVWRGNLHIRKPNGDTLVYHRPAIVDGDITFWGVDQKTKRWVLQRTYGGKLVENLTQAVARDLLAEAMVDIENDWGVVPVLHVHDELVYEVESLTQAKQLQEAAEFVPAWAKGLPLSSGMQLGERYRK